MAETGITTAEEERSLSRLRSSSSRAEPVDLRPPDHCIRAATRTQSACAGHRACRAEPPRKEWCSSCGWEPGPTAHPVWGLEFSLSLSSFPPLCPCQRIMNANRWTVFLERRHCVQPRPWTPSECPAAWEKRSGNKNQNPKSRKVLPNVTREFT